MARAPTRWLPSALLAALLGGLARGLPPAAAEGFASPEAAAATLLRSADPVERARAAAWLGTADSPRGRRTALPALWARLADPVADVRRAVAAALAALPEAASRAPLERALGAERDRAVLPPLLLALGGLRDPAVEPQLTAWLGDPAPAVRAAALTALAEAGGSGARARLLAALHAPGGEDPAWQVRGAALLGLSRVGRAGDDQAALAALREGGGWGHWFARSALAQALPRLAAAPLPLLERLTDDEDPRVALTAAVSLVGTAGAERLPALLSHPRPGVRAAAAGAAARLRLPQALPRLLALLRADPELSVRWAAALAALSLGAPEGEGAVLAALSSDEPAVWAEAVAALAARTGEQHGRDAAAWRRALARSRAR